MAEWKILKEPAGGSKPGEPWTDTGIVYDDANGPVTDYLAAEQATDGVCRGAERMP